MKGEVVLGRPARLEDIIEAHTSCGVEGLAEHGGGDAGEEAGGALRAEDLHADADRADSGRREGGGTGAGVEGESRAESGSRSGGFSLELHPDFDEIHRVGGAAGDDRRDPPFYKSFDAHFQREKGRDEARRKRMVMERGYGR